MYPKSFKKLIDHFASLPSIGPKMAERLVLYLFKKDDATLLEFAESLSELKSNLGTCQRCGNISEEEECWICLDKNRDRSLLCIVEDAIDVIAIEKTKRYPGIYHVLGGILDPLKNNGGERLNFSSLLDRVRDEKIKEVIIAMNPTTEGDATALYIARLLRSAEVKVTRLARGLATGGDIEHADELTLVSAITNRK